MTFPLVPVLIALWLTLQLGAILGYLLAQHLPPRRRWPTPPVRLHGEWRRAPRSEAA